MGKLAAMFLRPVAAVGFVVRSSSRSNVASDPTITCGTDSASTALASEPQGSIYIKTDGDEETTLWVKTGPSQYTALGDD